MIPLPDLQRLMAATHEGAHYVACEAFGIPVDRVVVHETATDGRVGFCAHPGAQVSTLHYLIVLAAGMHASSAFLPEVATELHAGVGYSDALRIDELLREKFPDEQARREAGIWLIGAADRFVVEFAAEIRQAAERLYRDGAIECAEAGTTSSGS